VRDFEMKFKELERVLKNDGWFIIRQKGSHKHLKHNSKTGTVTIAGKPNIDVPKGTLNNIFKQAKLK
jgi:predicted RNA binding protein YcfA (HicA-like mRNA interferase family)